MLRKTLCLYGIVCLLSAVALGKWPGEIARWRLDNNATDSVGEFEGTLQNSPAFTTDAVVGSHALALDGTQYVNCANPDGLPSGLQARSMCAWAKTESVSGYRFVAAYGTDFKDQAMFLGMTGTTLLGGGYSDDLTVGNFWATGVWHHLALTYDGSEAKLYADGALVASAAKTWNLVLLRAYLGRQVNDKEYWIGAIDDVRIFDTALSAEEVAMIFDGQDEQSHKPSPEDAATDVPRDVAMGWKAGMDATAHDVYFGTVLADVNDAHRPNPLDVLASKAQGATTFDPAGVLEFGQTYYWRVDEVNAAGTILKGEVWSFTIESQVYPIEHVIATSDATSDADCGPAKTVDGSGLDASNLHSTLNTDMWAGTADGNEPVSIQYEFDSVYKLHELWVWNYNLSYENTFGFGFKDVAIEYSADGTEWATLGDFQFAQGTGKANYTANTVVDFNGAAARYVRLTAKSGYGATGTYGLSEVRFYHVPVLAREAQPETGAVDVSVDAVLDWRAGREAVSHQVYLGTDANDLALAATVTASTYDPGALDLDTEYFWQIVEVNEAEMPTAWASDVWNFTTQQSLLVEDFESYNGSDDLLYETWLDGFGGETTLGGSMAGYIDSPFVETSIVKGGGQSMPIFYDNDGGFVNANGATSSPTFSEVMCEFDPAQDWSVNGIKTLVLYFCGSSDNAAGHMYVKINGVKVVHDSTTAIQSPAWTQWNVDLTSAGAKLAKVTSLSIGIDSTGSGLVHVDEIRLYREAPAIPIGVDPGTGNLVACYAMDSSLSDGSGHGHDATSPAAPTYIAGAFGQGIQFDGNDDYVEMPLESVINTLTSVTFALWANFSNEGGAWQRLFDFGSGTNDYMFLVPRVGSSGPIRYAIKKNAESIVTASVSLPSGWHHLAVVIDGTTRNTKIYLDSVVVGEAVTAYVPTDLKATTQNWLGRSQFSNDSFYNGSMDEFRIYNRVLSQDEVSYLAGNR